MQSLSFTPGRAFLSSQSTAEPWTVLFEDEGVAGYLYARDRRQQREEDSILDAMLIYNVASLPNPEETRLATIEWSRDGHQAVLYLDGTAQALFDFQARMGSCRSDFPNFLDGGGTTWRRNTHAWNEDAIERFESALYA